MSACSSLVFVARFILGRLLQVSTSLHFLHQSKHTGTPYQTKLTSKQWMDKIRSSRTCTDFILDFVDIIEQGLLVPDVNKRDYCEDVVNKLIRLQKRCREDERYYKFSAERQEESSLSSRQELEVCFYPLFTLVPGHPSVKSCSRLTSLDASVLTKYRSRTAGNAASRSFRRKSI